MDEAISEITAGGRSREAALTLCQVGRMTSSAWMGCAGPVLLLPTIEVDNPDTDLGKSGNTTPISYKCMQRNVGTIVARSSLS